VIKLKTRSNPVKVLIADGHALYSKALRLTLEMEDDIQVVGEAEDWPTLEQTARCLKPDVILIDVRMPDALGNENGINATTQIILQNPRTAIIVLSMLDDEEQAAKAERAGARGYILKENRDHELLPAIRAAARVALPANASHISTAI
jgi:LuxR family maltose regulon positive regulatory protein